MQSSPKCRLIGYLPVGPFGELVNKNILHETPNVLVGLQRLIKFRRVPTPVNPEPFKSNKPHLQYENFIPF